MTPITLSRVRPLLRFLCALAVSHLALGSLAAGTFLAGTAAIAQDADIESELDAYWANVAAYLAAGDYEGVVSTYHPDAVLVSERLGTSYPISRALKRWKPGILDTAAGKAMSFVEFRITRRLFSETTSHERGIFHFRTGPVGDDAREEDFDEDYVHFEGLLLKDGEWKLVMEYQKHQATKAEWEAATPE